MSLKHAGYERSLCCKCCGAERPCTWCAQSCVYCTTPEPEQGFMDDPTDAEDEE